MIGQKNKFIWTAGGVLLGEQSRTIFDNSCNEQRCGITSQINVLLLLPAVLVG